MSFSNNILSQSTTFEYAIDKANLNLLEVASIYLWSIFYWFQYIIHLKFNKAAWRKN